MMVTTTYLAVHMHIYQIQCELLTLCATPPPSSLFFQATPAIPWGAESTNLSFTFYSSSSSCSPSHTIHLLKDLWTRTLNIILNLSPFLSASPQSPQIRLNQKHWPFLIQQGWSLFLEQSSCRYSHGYFWSWLQLIFWARPSLTTRCYRQQPPYLIFLILSCSIFFLYTYQHVICLLIVCLPHQKFSAMGAWGYLVVWLTNLLCLY